MCGRGSLALSPAELKAFLDQFEVESPEWYSPRYNVAPSTGVMTVVEGGTESCARDVAIMKWGLVPFWAKDPSIGSKMINARAETVSEKPAYREAFKRRRALMIFDSFYEWRTETSGPKTPFRVRRADGRPLAIAALWERWKPKDDPDAEPLLSAAVLTKAANDSMSHVHDRMPVVLDDEAAMRWLDDECNPAALREIIDGSDTEFAPYAISPLVNSPRNDSEACWERVEVG